MSLQNGRRGNWAKYTQLIQSLRTESRACVPSLEYSVLARLSAPTYRSAVWICLNFIIFHFAGSSIYVQLRHLRCCPSSPFCQASELHESVNFRLDLSHYNPMGIMFSYWNKLINDRLSPGLLKELQTTDLSNFFHNLKIILRLSSNR